MSFFEEFATSSKADSHLLLRLNDIELYQFSHYNYMCSGGYVVQGAIDTLAPSHVQSPVVDAMLAGLQLLQATESVLNLGLGCAAIERYLHTKHPAASVLTVDCSEDVIELCKQADLLPEGCTPVVADAAEFLKQATTCFDAVFCDLAIGKKQPQILCSESFYRDCEKRMSESAILVVNVLCQDNETLREVCLAARTVFAWTAVIDISGFDNVVMYARATAPHIDVSQCSNAQTTELKTLLSHARILP
ncbi:MAG: spermidine synthase [Pseudomonadales bacterium]